ncbi:MAG: adenine methyltransferase [Rhodanobacter sp.]|nr:adenine methyltransferase [Rhodanobacter sp.]
MKKNATCNPVGTATTTWLTPRKVIAALGPFDLDPCTPVEGMPWPTAKRMLTPAEDGLNTPWPKEDFVWHNPPYGKGIEKWLAKAADHGHGITLVHVRMDTVWMHEQILNHPNARGLVFTCGRIRFHRLDGTAGEAPPVGSLFVAYGEVAALALQHAVAVGAITGCYVPLNGRGGVAANDGGFGEETSALSLAQ